MNQEQLFAKIDQLRHRKILVIGDIILDAYYLGKVMRVSPEAPVPVLDIERKEFRLGGAANVALNIQGLGIDPILCSVVGQDETSNQVTSLMKSQGLSIAGIKNSALRKTSVKTRMMSEHHQLLRIDEEQTDELSEVDERELMSSIESLIASEKPVAIIFEDYDKGVITKTIINQVVAIANGLGIPVTVDPKRRNFLSYSGVDLFKPNLKELKEGLNLPELIPNENDLKEAFETLNKQMPVKSVLFTLSAHGMFICNGEQSHSVKAYARNITDVSGAGDTVISVATVALAAGLSLEEIVFLANFAGGWVCQFPGVVSIDLDTIKQEIAKSID